jgi:AcrR family transcriptional regulator
MNVKPRTQVERTEATRAALIAAGRELFGERGYGAVGTEEIVARAGVTRGALYHQFADKRDLFRAVVVALEEDVIGRVAIRAAAGASGAGEVLRRAMSAWLDVCDDPVVHRIMLLDAPGVLGWEEWRAIGERFGLGTTMALLQAAMDEGVIARQPARPLAHVVIGALDEAALYVSRAEDRATARAEMDGVLERLVIGLA